MKLRKSSYCYVYSSFSCYSHKQQHNSYCYDILKPSDRVKNRVLQPNVGTICSIIHIYDTLQLTLFNKSWASYNWILLAL